MKRVQIERLRGNIFITPTIGITKVSKVFDNPKHINLCLGWLEYSMSIRIWEEKEK